MRKILNFVGFISLCCFIFITPVFAYQSNNINVVINGQAVEFTSDSGFPYIDHNNRTMVPLRITMEECGAAVGYDTISQTAIVITEHDRIEVPIGTNIIYNNNVKILNDTNAVINNGRTYLPIRAVLESAGYTVEWDSNSNSVIAYNFSFNNTELVPYNTSDLSTLTSKILSGDVVYINGQYYATPEYYKQFNNVKVYYWGDDLNKSIYPQEDDIYELIYSEDDFIQDTPIDLDGIASWEDL